MTDDRKKELFPYFAFMFSQELNAEKYGNKSYEEWATLIEKSPEDINKITDAATSLSDDQWEALDADYTAQTSEDAVETDEVTLAKKGAKLKKLQTYKKGRKVGAKKCACGCKMISTKEKGGKISSKCSCGCGGKMKK